MISCISNETTTSCTRENSVGNEILVMKYQYSSKPTAKRVIQVPTDLDLIQPVKESLLEEEKVKRESRRVHMLWRMSLIYLLLIKPPWFVKWKGLIWLPEDLVEAVTFAILIATIYFIIPDGFNDMVEQKAYFFLMLPNLLKECKCQT